MDLYDDIDTKPRTAQIDGWSSGIKMLQTQLQIKKAQAPKETLKKPVPQSNQNNNPNFQKFLKTRPNKLNDWEENVFKENATEINTNNNEIQTQNNSLKNTIISSPLPKLENLKAEEWDFVDEYDPQWPNEYDKLKEKLQTSKEERGTRRGRNDVHGEERDRKRRGRGSSTSNSGQSNSGQWKSSEEDYSNSGNSRTNPSKSGAAIAPPPSLQENSLSINNENDSSSNVTIPYSASSVAAKIMAKYGFKDGQGLGKQQQGMAVALQVEKTSKRGGRIIHENDVFLPPPPPVGSSPSQGSSSMLSGGQEIISDEKETANETEPTITEIMKSPSKVVLLRNMVGPGDVDEDLEPEVKDECNTKYGEVANVVIHELFGTSDEEAVKIYVEFKRIESAIKAVVDLNGRFFGGRQVRAGFYEYDKFKKFQLH